MLLDELRMRKRAAWASNAPKRRSGDLVRVTIRVVDREASFEEVMERVNIMNDSSSGAVWTFIPTRQIYLLLVT